MYLLIFLNFLTVNCLIFNSVFSSEKAAPTLPFSCEILNAGVANNVFLIKNQDDEKFVLKIYKRKTAEQLKQTFELLKLVEAQGMKVPKTVIPPTKIGSQTISMSEFVEGEHIDDSNLQDVAKLMAKLHVMPCPLTSLPAPKDFQPLFEKCSGWKYCSSLKKIYDSLDLSYREDLPRGIIHGDFSYTNLLRDQDASLTLIDFDHLRYDSLLTDVVRCQLFYGFDASGNLKPDLPPKSCNSPI